MQLYLRAEKKLHERRAALTPNTAKTLITQHGFEIFVERDQQRVFEDEEYESVGCKLVESHTWPNAPLSIPILGLKELPASPTTPLEHTHIHFAHCYKTQSGWSEFLNRFTPSGKLYDLEFLEDSNGRRVAAFGFWAGFVGAGVGILAYAAQQNNTKLGFLHPYANETALVEAAKSALSGKQDVKVLVMGALGRCGRGAVDLFQKIGLKSENILQWDLAETAAGGPFPQLVTDIDIFVNCIYLASPIPPFFTLDTIKEIGDKRRLSVIVDVSCDTTNPHNPIPVYSENSTFEQPTLPVQVEQGSKPLDMISIDHLPTLLPREASEQFAADLLPSLIQLPNKEKADVWRKAGELFEKKKREAQLAQ